MPGYARGGGAVGRGAPAWAQAPAQRQPQPPEPVPSRNSPLQAWVPVTGRYPAWWASAGPITICGWIRSYGGGPAGSIWRAHPGRARPSAPWAVPSLSPAVLPPNPLSEVVRNKNKNLWNTSQELNFANP